MNPKRNKKSEFFADTSKTNWVSCGTKHLFLSAIMFYKKISTAFRVSRIPIFIYTDCKFYPTCSDYAIKAVGKYGVVRGVFKSTLRVLRCSPFSKGGVDIP